MFIPILKKLIFSQNVLIERVLPHAGRIFVEQKDEVAPSDKIGSCLVSYEIVELGKLFRRSHKISMDGIHLLGTKLGYIGTKAFRAPFNGFLQKTEAGFIYKSEEQTYPLLPGVWGEVIDIADNHSVLLKTQTIDVHLPVVSKTFTAGELIVFPNPSELLGRQYLDNYLKSAAEKIIYIGNTITSIDLVARAKTLGVNALLTGSAPKDVFTYAKSIQMPLGLFVGFGNAPTPGIVYSFLNGVSHRYVFFDGDKNILRVPVPKDYNNELVAGVKPDSIFRNVEKGMRVQVFDPQYFGITGTVDSVSESSIFVELDGNTTQVEVSPSNVFLLGQ